MSSLLQIKAGVSGFLKIEPKSVLGDFELTLFLFEKTLLFQILKGDPLCNVLLYGEMMLKIIYLHIKKRKNILKNVFFLVN